MELNFFLFKEDLGKGLSGICLVEKKKEYLMRPRKNKSSIFFFLLVVQSHEKISPPSSFSIAKKFLQTTLRQ